MFKYNINDVVYYLRDNKVYSSVIFQRNYYEGENVNKQININVWYSVLRHPETHYPEDKLFVSKEELLASL